MKKKVLLITGSMNQTLQMQQIAEQLPEYDCWFSQIFTDNPLVNFLLERVPLLDGTILGKKHRNIAESYLRSHDLKIDYRGISNEYDLVIYCTDMLIPKRMQKTRLVFVQEGMTDRVTWKSRLVKTLGLPAWFTGDTSLNGSSNVCDIYCVASPGYKAHFTGNGIDPHKILVTGIPNYDNVRSSLVNDFPHQDYVMVATSDIRETFRWENRKAFIKEAVRIAAGRRLLFKLHPNEKMERAVSEIKNFAPAGTLIYQRGNTLEMIANCIELITQYSTVVYAGIILKKKVHSYFDRDVLQQLKPWQNNGSSAANIAQTCRNFLEYSMISMKRYHAQEDSPVDVSGLLDVLDER
jgi:hypothetical protein